MSSLRLLLACRRSSRLARMSADRFRDTLAEPVLGRFEDTLVAFSRTVDVLRRRLLLVDVGAFPGVVLVGVRPIAVGSAFGWSTFG